jgi:hypothetical protein
MIGVVEGPKLEVAISSFSSRSLPFLLSTIERSEEPDRWWGAATIFQRLATNASLAGERFVVGGNAENAVAAVHVSRRMTPGLAPVIPSTRAVDRETLIAGVQEATVF